MPCHRPEEVAERLRRRNILASVLPPVRSLARPVIASDRDDLVHLCFQALPAGLRRSQQRYQSAHRGASAVDVLEQSGMPLDEPGEAVVDYRVEHGPRPPLQGGP